MNRLEPIEVFDPAPFGSTPNLTFPTHPWVHDPRAVEQRPDGFKVQVTSFARGQSRLHWKAVGVTR